MDDKTIAPRQWYLANYPALAWAETVIKMSAMALGIMALVAALSRGVFVLPEGVRFVEFIIMAILVIGLVAVIFDRFIEREIIAMVFVIFNNLAHWGIVASLIMLPGENPYLFGFCALMAVGEMVKTIFIKAHSFQVRNLSQLTLFALTAVYLTGYIVIMIMELLR